jgi:hypothetical protein
MTQIHTPKMYHIFFPPACGISKSKLKMSGDPSNTNEDTHILCHYHLELLSAICFAHGFLSCHFT